MVLQLRAADGVYFTNRVLAAQAAGFEFSERGPTTLALVSRDTREDIAIMHVEHGKEAMCVLSVIVVSLDPNTCPIEWLAGTRFIQAIKKFAQLMNATVCDESGAQLEEDDIQAIKARVNAVMEARQGREIKNRQRTTMPDGTVRVDTEGLSFIGRYQTKRGRHLRTEYFDVPPLSWDDGQIRGLQIAAEFLAYMRSHREDRYWYRLVIEDAIKAHAEGSSCVKPARGNAAVSFVEVIVATTAFAAQSCRFEPWIERRIQQQRQRKADREEIDAEQKSAFVERMKAARLRKSEERAKQAQPVAKAAPMKPARQRARKAEMVEA